MAWSSWPMMPSSFSPVHRLEDRIDHILPREQTTSAEKEAIAAAMDEREKVEALH